MRLIIFLTIHLIIMAKSTISYIEKKITLPVQNQAHMQSKNSHKRRYAPPRYGEKFNFPNFVYARNDYGDWLPVYGGRLPNVQLGRKSLHVWRLLRNTWEISISLRSVTLRCHYGGSVHRPLVCHVDTSASRHPIGTSIAWVTLFRWKNLWKPMKTFSSPDSNQQSLNNESVAYNHSATAAAQSGRKSVMIPK